MVSDTPSRVIFSHCFTNCNSLPARGTFGISSVNNFLTARCMKVIDASGTSFELWVSETSFRFSKEVFTLCCWTSMLKFPFAIMLKQTLEFTMFLFVSIIWFPRVVKAPSAMRFILTVPRAFSKGIFLPTNIFKGFQWLPCRFFYLYHMRSKLFSKEVSFPFLQNILMFLLLF